MYIYEDQFSDKHNFVGEADVATANNATLVIASTPRCGSHMLGHALHATGRFGFPLEYVNQANLKRWMNKLNTSNLPDTMARLRALRTSPNGVFGIKVHYSHIRMFGSFAGLLATFTNPFFVHLTRGNALDQAVSYAIASQTGIWIGSQDARGDTAVYDYRLIEKCLKRVLRHNASWGCLLESYGCRYLALDFDTLRRQFPEQVCRIADFMGLDAEGLDVQVSAPTKRQGGQINLKWKQRFIDDTQSHSRLRDRGYLGEIGRLF